MTVCPARCTMLGRACNRQLVVAASQWQCCHQECLAGCYGPMDTQCIACIHVTYAGRCLRKCPRGTYQVYTHTHPFNSPFSGTTRVSRYQKRKTNLDFTGARDSEWQWHQLGHMQVCISVQTDNHAITPPLMFFTGRMPFLPPNQQRQSK